MAKNGMTVTQAKHRLHSVMQVPQYVVIASVDGVPRHIVMFSDAEEASDYATSDEIQALYKDLAENGDGHYIRTTLHVVSSQVDPDFPELPAQVSTIYEAFETWHLGTRPKHEAKFPPERISHRPKADEAAPAKTTAKKPTTKKAAAPKTTVKKPAAPKAAAKKAAPRRGGAGPKQTAKKPSAKTPTRRATRRTR